MLFVACCHLMKTRENSFDNILVGRIAWGNTQETGYVKTWTSQVLMNNRHGWWTQTHQLSPHFPHKNIKRRILIYPTLLYLPQVIYCWFLGHFKFASVEIPVNNNQTTKPPAAFKINMIFTWIILKTCLWAHHISSVVHIRSNAIHFFPHFL